MSQIKQILATEILTYEFKQQASEAFSNHNPIRHIVIDNFLQPEIAEKIFQNFPGIDNMNTHYKGINEKKAEHSDFSHLHPYFETVRNTLASNDFTEWLTSITNIPSLESVPDRLGYGLHQGANNSFLDVHVDYNIHPIKKLYRKLNLILFFNSEWKDSWGGHLELWDKDVKNCIQKISPVLNRCVIFECSSVSYHGYKKITVPEGITRKSYYQYFFTPIPLNTNYHDTIFKPVPETGITKKTLTLSKDMIKNVAKKVFYTIGLKKFLK